MSNNQSTSIFPSNKALEVFDFIIGVWDTEGAHGLIPDTTLHGRTTFEWHESGGFIIMNTNIQEDVGIPTGMTLIASDDELGTYVMSYYDERGISRFYNLSLQGDVMKWWRESPDFSQRNSLTISKDRQTMVGKGELSKDGVTWEKDLDLTYRKVTD